MTSPRSSKIKVLFDEAENALKRYERINLSNLAPAVNELRYAGHHLLWAENAEEDDEREAHEAQAIDHCERAKKDAKEATIISLLECVADLRSWGVSADDMRKFIPDWDEFIDEAAEARSVLERSGIWETDNNVEVDQAIDNLMAFRDRILIAEPKVHSLLEQREMEARKIEEYNLAEKARVENETNIEKERKEDRRYVLSIILSLMGIVLGGLGLAVAILGIILTLKTN